MHCIEKALLHSYSFYIFVFIFLTGWLTHAFARNLEICTNPQSFSFALLIIVTCVGCDQTTKHLAQTNLPIYQMFSYLGDTVRLQYVLNTGAAFSLGASLPENVRWWIFVVGQGLSCFS